MGWTIQIHKKILDEIFTEQKKVYSVTYVSSLHPTVIVAHEGTIHASTMRKIVELFPEFVYVDFQPNTLFSVGTRKGIAGVV